MSKKRNFEVQIAEQDGTNVTLTFRADGFAFGTDERLDEITIPIEQLLDVLQRMEEAKDDQ
jgi:hypothetical protein